MLLKEKKSSSEIVTFCSWLTDKLTLKWVIHKPSPTHFFGFGECYISGRCLDLWAAFCISAKKEKLQFCCTGNKKQWLTGRIWMLNIFFTFFYLLPLCSTRKCTFVLKTVLFGTSWNHISLLKIILYAITIISFISINCTLRVYYFYYLLYYLTRLYYILY